MEYPKILFTARKKYLGEDIAIYYPAYEDEGMIPDIIPGREFYKDGKLVRLINELEK